MLKKGGAGIFFNFDNCMYYSIEAMIYDPRVLETRKISLELENDERFFFLRLRNSIEYTTKSRYYITD